MTAIAAVLAVLVAARWLAAVAAALVPAPIPALALSGDEGGGVPGPVEAPAPTAEDDLPEVEVRELDEGDDTALWDRYPGQTSAQDAYVSLNCEAAILRAAVNGEIGNAVPFSVWHRLVLRWSIPSLLPEVANELLREIAPLARRVVAGFEIQWDGHNNVGRYTDDADEACAEIEALCSGEWSEEQQVREWDARDWYNGGAQAELVALGLTATSTDQECAALADELRDDVERGLFVTGLDRLVTDARDELVEVEAAVEEAAQGHLDDLCGDCGCEGDCTCTDDEALGLPTGQAWGGDQPRWMSQRDWNDRCEAAVRRLAEERFGAGSDAEARRSERRQMGIE